jgi:Clostridium epsilon toxin ETX/Bacillus mosquitocidal toxin MTX2
MAFYPSITDIVTAWRTDLAKQQTGLRRKAFESRGNMAPKCRLSDVQYSPVDNLPGTPWQAASIVYTNSSSVEQSATYETTEEIGRTTTATVEKSVEVGVEVGFEVSFPGGVGASAKTTVTGGTTNTESTSTSTKDTKRLTVPVRVPPHTKVSAQAYATKKKQEVKWTAQLAVLGVWTSDRITEKNGGDTSSVQVRGFLAPVVAAVDGQGVIDVSGWSHRKASYDEMRQLWGSDLDGEPVDGAGQYVFSTGKVSGTMTFEDFVDINVDVRETGPAVTAESPGDADGGELLYKIEIGDINGMSPLFSKEIEAQVGWIQRAVNHSG